MLGNKIYIVSFKKNYGINLRGIYGGKLLSNKLKKNFVANKQKSMQSTRGAPNVDFTIRPNNDYYMY